MLHLAVGTVLTRSYQEIALSLGIYGTRTGRNQNWKRTGFDNSFKCSLFSVFKSGGDKCLLNTREGNGRNCPQDQNDGDQRLNSSRNACR